MTDNQGLASVPVWTLATQQAELPDILGDSMTPERLGELRAVLATLAAEPVTTLEAHPAPNDLDRSHGMPLGAASPLATQLTTLIARTPKAATGTGAGEVLYRMVVPAKVAAQVGGDLIKPMAAKGGGVHSALTNGTRIAAHARFVPVAAGGTAIGGAAAVGGAAAAITVAAPLVLMAVAAGAAVQAERERQEEMRQITDLLKKLDAESLRQERSKLNGCRDAIDKATAILLDEGRIGASLGLDAAVYAVNVAIADAEERLTAWQHSLKALGDGPVDLARLRKAFADIDHEDGEFRAHLALAGLAVALKKRVIVVQAVEYAQAHPEQLFKNFTDALQRDQRRVVALEKGVSELLGKISALQLDRNRGFRDFMFSGKEVDELLRTSRTLRSFEERVAVDAPRDMTIDIIRAADGSVVVLPAVAAWRDPIQYRAPRERLS